VADHVGSEEVTLAEHVDVDLRVGGEVRDLPLRLELDVGPPITTSVSGRRRLATVAKWKLSHSFHM